MKSYENITEESCVAFNLSFIFVTVDGLFEWKRICTGFSLVVYMYFCFAIGDPSIKRGRVGIP
jgi:hypothetical protein